MELFAPTSVENIWIVTFEYSGVASLGGLGEAVRVRAEMLARRGKNVTVLMPSHGRHRDALVRARLGLRDSSFSECDYRRGVNGVYYRYCIGAEEALVNGVRVILFKGLDRVTSNILDEWSIYSWVEEKASLLARAAKAHAQRSGKLPDLVDVNDWHSVTAGIAAREEAERRGLSIPLVYTIHLSGSPSFPWHYASQEWSGIEDSPHLVWRATGHNLEYYSGIWNSVGGNVEAFGVHEADLIVTVSISYLREELARRYGDWILGKSCVVYNTTDLRVGDVERWIKENYGGIAHGLEWRIVDNIMERYRRWGYLDKNGELLVALGRLTWQKGFDIAVKALDYTPTTRLLILGLPVGDLSFEDTLRGLVEERPGRVAVVLDRVSFEVRNAIIRLSRSAVVPSRWEPFGLIALESMALGTPVIASSTGGLREIVVDLRGNPNGTGLLARPEDPMDLGYAMESMVILMSGRDRNLIPFHELRVMDFLSEPVVRGNAVKLVEGYFREPSIYGQLETCYEMARQMAYYKAIASHYVKVS